MARTTLKRNQGSHFQKLVAKLLDHDLALDAIAGDGLASGEDTIGPGAAAIPAATQFTNYSVSGTQSNALGAGTYIGQRKKIVCSVAASTPNGTVTGLFVHGGTNFANIGGWDTATTASTVGDSVELRWNGTRWRVYQLSGVTLS
jgi:hypothetical protein